jgi:hypothetical protein
MDLDIITDINMLEEDRVLLEQETMIRGFCFENRIQMAHGKHSHHVIVTGLVKPRWFHELSTNQCSY